MAESIALWDADPVAEFRRFIVSEAYLETSQRPGSDEDGHVPVSEESARVYIWMFNKFCRWMTAEHLRMSTLTENDLARFLKIGAGGQADIASSIRERYLRLIERCYVHLQVRPNPAQHTLFRDKDTGARGKDLAMTVLTDDEISRFLAALPRQSVKYPRGGLFNGWKRRRDRAMQLTMLFAGVTVSEVVGLQMSEIDRQPRLDGTLPIRITPMDKHETSVAHETYLKPTAVAEVLDWLTEREGMKVPGTLAYPASPDGEPLNKATVYRQVRKTFERAGINPDRRGGRTLRNTFAVSALQEGMDRHDLQEILGLAEDRSTEPYVKKAIKKNEAKPDQ